MTFDLALLIYLAGWGQLSVLIASALVPIRLDWANAFSPLPKLLRQMYWVYGGYVVLSIISLGVICIANADELAAGSRLARSFCAFCAIFWGIRISLQPVLAARPFLTTWWLRAGYHLLTVAFASFVLILGWGAVH